jgi:hypothetical protein
LFAANAFDNIDIAKIRVGDRKRALPSLETSRRTEQDRRSFAPEHGIEGAISEKCFCVRTSSCQISDTKWKWLRSKARPRCVDRRQNPTNDYIAATLTAMRRRSVRLCSIDPVGFIGIAFAFRTSTIDPRRMHPYLLSTLGGVT